MDLLYAPWRALYSQEKTNTCPFCFYQNATPNDQNFILTQTKKAMIIMNLYPYNIGHILITPKKHVPFLHNLSPQERSEIMELTSISCEILFSVLNCTGINNGYNVGSDSAGGSIPQHIHAHVLPRWQGDTNFLTTLAQTKPLSFDMRETYHKLFPHFSSITL